MVGQDFLFKDKHLLDFGFIMAQPKNGDDISGLNRTILKGTMNAYRSQAVHYGTSYNDTLTLPLFIFKNSCDYDDSIITPFELRRIQSWLTSSKLPETLYIFTSEGTIIEYVGIFNEISPYSYNGLNGLNITFTCDSPFVYETKETKVSETDAVNGITKRMFCDTDETEEFLYPYIQYYPTSAGTVSLKNNNDNGNKMSFTITDVYNEVIIDCRLKRIIADGTPLTLSDVGLNIEEITDYNNVNTGIYKMYWLRLLPKMNYVEIQGDGDFIITYKNLLKLGGLVNV